METNFTDEQKYIRAKKRVKTIRGFYVHLTIYLAVNAILVILRLASGEGFEMLWKWQTYNTALFWGIGIGIHALNVFGLRIALGKDWEERKIREIMDKDKKKYWE